MGKDRRGKRDGTGPFEKSFQRKINTLGARRLAGEKCPVSKKK